MFIDEIKMKLQVRDDIKMINIFDGSNSFYASGIKKILFINDREIRLRFETKVVAIKGSGLDIVEVGGSDVLIKGDIESVNFE